MKTTAQKWGNSLAIRVPKSVAQQVGLKEQDDLEIEVQDGNVVYRQLDPQRQPMGAPRRMSASILVANFIPEAAAF